MAVSGSLSLCLWLERGLIVHALYSDVILAVQILTSYHCLDCLHVSFSRWLNDVINLFAALLGCAEFFPCWIFLVVVLCFGLGGGWWMAYKGLHWGSHFYICNGNLWFLEYGGHKHLALRLSAFCFRFS